MRSRRVGVSTMIFLAALGPAAASGHTFEAPDSVAADASGFFSYQAVFRAGPGSAFLAAWGWNGLVNVPGGLVVDCFCIPEFCVLAEGDSVVLFVDAYLADPTEFGLVENWIAGCEPRGSGVVNTTVVPHATAAGIVPRPVVANIRARPNPFARSTELAIDLEEAAGAVVEVVDVRGRVVRGLWSGGLAAGTTTLTWEGRDDAGGRVAAGVYFVRLTTGEISRTRKVVYLGRD
ncbi:MAG: FlgD immunoglobulin-like domain containing protein [bacterium]